MKTAVSAYLVRELFNNVDVSGCRAGGAASAARTADNRLRPLVNRGVLRLLLPPSGEYLWRYSSRSRALVLFASGIRRVRRRERRRHRVSQILKAFGEFGAAGGASPAEESLGALESLTELLVWLV